METKATVFVVEDDPLVRQYIDLLLRAHSLNTETYPSAEDFLAAYDPSRPGCILLDIRLTGMSGLELQARLVKQHDSIPIIFLTGFGDVESAVTALKAGAIDFIEKPIAEQLLLDDVRLALERDAQTRRQQVQIAECKHRIALLTERQREVAVLLAAGRTMKQIASLLGLSEKTVQVHRAHVLEKLQIATIAELVRLWLAVEESTSVKTPPRNPI